MGQHYVRELIRLRHEKKGERNNGKGSYLEQLKMKQNCRLVIWEGVSKNEKGPRPL